MRFLLLFPLVFLFSISLSAQSINHYEGMEGAFPASAEKAHYHNAKDHAPQGSLLWVKMWSFYKEYISSQDGQNCPFSPTCSAYALQAVQKKGIVVGLLMAFDRLSRCNGAHLEHYPVVNGRYQDHVE